MIILLFFNNFFSIVEKVFFSDILEWIDFRWAKSSFMEYLCDFL